MKITLLADNPKSWISPYVKKIAALLRKGGHSVQIVDHPKKIRKGDMVFLLGCEKIVKPDILKSNKHNLVVHESNLPKGKGWSPLTWQILEGKKRIPIVLFEAEERVDSGLIYLKDWMNFGNTELLNEIKRVQGKKTIELVLRYVDNWKKIKGIKQKGISTYYKKRNPNDSKLNMDRTLRQLFNSLRVCDNKRYPAFFDYLGHRYIIKIYEKNIPDKL